MKKEITIFGFVLLSSVIFNSCSDSKENTDAKKEKKEEVIELVKDKDGNGYNTVVIGKQEWLATNLNTSKFQNGDLIKQAQTEEEWTTACEKNEPAWRFYNNNVDNGDRYGKLYNWYALNDERKIAPNGYHIPTIDEWQRLIDFLGGNDVASSKIKSTNFWASNDQDLPGTGNNESGFGALPGGCYEKIYEDDQLGTCGYWWTSSIHNDKGKKYFWAIQITRNNVIQQFNGEHSYPKNIPITEAIKRPFFISGYSVRCVKD